ncbi:competence protein CoiA family protein [Paractinoplanes maris]|uniref:competence protein CoiA family protein n=1 Tax=Paractinoplanes maris TaxID=1734446 RepID=UPI00201FF4BF|nr:competence protein CoiA family protein [Actinoplanes maris]
MSPNTAVWYVPAQIELDLRDEPSLGHPEHPGLLGRLYSPGASRPFREGVLQCPQCRDMNPDCPEWMFLRRRNGLLHAVHHNPGIRDHDEGESDAHKALKERIATAAQRNGLEADTESASPDRKRRTDVLIHGGNQDLAFEAQISYASRENVQRRSKRARRDGLTPLWTTPSLKAPLVDVAPWAGIKRMPWQEYLSVTELPVIGGVRTLTRRECGRTGALCPDRKKGRTCPGWHFEWEPKQMRNLDDLVVRAAYGEWIPYEHRTSKGSIRWFWVRAAEANQVEQETEARPSKRRRPGPDDQDVRPLDRTCTYGEDTTVPEPLAAGPLEPIVVSAAQPVAAAPPPARQPEATMPRPSEPFPSSTRRPVIVPGTLPVAGDEETASANLVIFLDEVRRQAAVERQVRGTGGQVGEAVRDRTGDLDGRFAWMIVVNGQQVQVRMPGVDLEILRGYSVRTPCLMVNGEYAWWGSAIYLAVPIPRRTPRQ